MHKPFSSQVVSGGFAVVFCSIIPVCFNWQSPFAVPTGLLIVSLFALLISMYSDEGGDENLAIFLTFSISTLISFGWAVVCRFGGIQKFIGALNEERIAVTSAAALVVVALALFYLIACVASRISMERGVDVSSVRCSTIATVIALSMAGLCSWVPTIICGSLPLYLYSVSILSPSWLMRCPGKEGG